MNEIKVDNWVWGNETIVWGYSSDHKYTLKVLEPKKGRTGCLSLQYHNEKSETWYTLRGVGWGMFVVNGEVCTKILKVGDFINIPTGIIHRLMAISEDLQIIEPSTPDRHAADKSAPKDVIRLDCVHGRECSIPRDEHESKIVEECKRITEEAIAKIEQNQMPKEYNSDQLEKFVFRL